MRKNKITKGSGNVFADIGLPDSEQCLKKAKLVGELIAVIERLKLTQAEAAKILHVDQPRVSDLMRGRFYRFSLAKLIDFLDALGKRVVLTIEDKARGSMDLPYRAATRRATARGA